jgi:general secretion pathway protein B
MSYILEALRRAESERERKRHGVPGLHAQPMPAGSPDDLSERRGRPWLWVVIGLSVGVLLMLLWRAWSPEPLLDEAMLARAPVAGSVTPQEPSAAPPAATQAPSTSTAPASAPASTPAAPPHAKTAPTPDKARPTLSKGATAATHPAPAGASGPRASTPAQTPPAEAPRTAAPAPDGAAPRPAPIPEPRLRTLAELPEDLRRSVPALTFGGSVFSETPAQRMVIFNGQVMREGDAVTDELQLEQIRPRSAVMRMRGQRFEIAF